MNKDIVKDIVKAEISEKLRKGMVYKSCPECKVSSDMLVFYVEPPEGHWISQSRKYRCLNCLALLNMDLHKEE